MKTLTEKEMTVLGIIYVFGFGWNRMISKITGIDKSHVSKILKKLKNEGYIIELQNIKKKRNILKKLPKEYWEKQRNLSNKDFEKLLKEIKVYVPVIRSRKYIKPTKVAIEIFT